MGDTSHLSRQTQNRPGDRASFHSSHGEAPVSLQYHGRDRMRNDKGNYVPRSTVLGRTWQAFLG